MPPVYPKFWGKGYGEGGLLPKDPLPHNSSLYKNHKKLLCPTCKQTVYVGDFRAVNVAQVLDTDVVVFLGE